MHASVNLPPAWQYPNFPTHAKRKTTRPEANVVSFECAKNDMLGGLP